MNATLYTIKRDLPGSIAILARPRGGDWLGDEMDAIASAGVDVLVSMLTQEESRELFLESEEDECASRLITFLNFPVLDRSVPSNRDEFLKHAKRVTAFVQAGNAVGVHCRAGIGRSAMLAATVLIQLGFEANDAFEAIAKVRGCPVPDTAEQKQWVTELNVS